MQTILKGATAPFLFEHIGIDNQPEAHDPVRVEKLSLAGLKMPCPKGIDIITDS